MDASKLPAIPPASGAGPDGFPKLPAINKMLDDADQTMKSINAQASALEKRVVQAQMEKAATMERQKAVFEGKLHAQEEENRAMVAANDAISKEIAALEAGNAALTKHAKELQADNALMRLELESLQASLASAGSYASETLAQTDDSHAEALSVLDPKAAAEETPPPAKKHHHGHHDHGKAWLMESSSRAALDDAAEADAEADGAADDAQDDDYDAEDSAAESFLSVAHSARLRATARRQEPDVNARSIVDTLQQGLESLQKQERDGEAKLKELFISAFQAGSKRHEALEVHQKALNWTRASLLSTQGKLKAAESHLSDTKQRLQLHVRGLGLFVQRLAHLALAPPTEVPHLLQALPNNISAAEMPEQAATPKA